MGKTGVRHDEPQCQWRRGRSRWRWLAWGLVCLALLGAFAGYTAPDFMLLLANQWWGCF